MEKHLRHQVQFFAERNISYGRDGVSIIAKEGDYILTDAKLVFTHRDELEVAVYSPPPLVLSEDAAQSLLQALWNAGLRPNDGESSMAHVAAKDKHLQDMRAIVAAKLKVDLP